MYAPHVPVNCVQCININQTLLFCHPREGGGRWGRGGGESAGGRESSEFVRSEGLGILSE